LVIALQEKLHLDEVAHLQEVSIMIHHNSKFNQIVKLYADELREYVQKEVGRQCAPIN
jgi:hypothetical protein